jgi:hypothetical protein
VVANLDPVLGKQAELLADGWLANKSGVAMIRRSGAVGGDVAWWAAALRAALAASKQARDRSSSSARQRARWVSRSGAGDQGAELVRSKDIDLRDSLDRIG